MTISNVKSGQNIPHDINVVIEIPAYSDPVKYEVDKATGALFVDRFMATSMRYPCNYGYIPHTLCADGDPVDVLVISPFPVVSGAVIQCRPLDVLKMTDESGLDYKILAVPNDKLCLASRHIKTSDDLPPLLKEQISHFFEHYKDLEPNKWVKVEGYLGVDAAKEEVIQSIARYKNTVV